MANSLRLLSHSFLVAIMLMHVAASYAQPVTVPPGLLPFETYRLVFATSTGLPPTSTNIADYDNFVESIANTVPELVALQTNWRVIGSTLGVDARDHTETVPGQGGVPIYGLDGVKIVDDYTDLWDGSLDSAIIITETGASSPTPLGVVHAGTQIDGTVFPGQPLGEPTAVRHGRIGQTGTRWMDEGSIQAQFARAYLAISDPLVVAPPPPWPGMSLGGQNVIVQNGIAAASCGTLLSSTVSERFTFGLFDIAGVVPAAGRSEVVVGKYHHPSWIVSEIGNVFGVAINERTGDILVAASSNYGSDFFVGTAVLNYGDLGGGPQSLLAAGTVYRADGATGQASVFTVLPQQSISFSHTSCEGGPSLPRTTGVGLGNIHYDKFHNQYFVTNIEDGRIYRIDASGSIVESYDPGLYDDNAPGITDLDDLVYGVAIEPGGQRLFFGGVTSNSTGVALQSIDLRPDGGFSGTVNNSMMPAGANWDNYVGVETLHAFVTAELAGTYGLSDIEFTPDGNVLVGLRVGCSGSWFTSYNHFGESNLYALDSGTGLYSTLVSEFDVSVTGFDAFEDSYGGVSYFQQADLSVDYVVSSSDILNEVGPHGLAVFHSGSAATSPIDPLAAISYGLAGDLKGVGGSVDVLSLPQPLVDTNHYKVYETDNVPLSRKVIVSDKFGSISTRLVSIDLFANPVDKNAEGLPRPAEHMKWYSLTDPNPQAHSIEFSNQFGLQHVIALQATHLVVPSEKNSEGPPGTCSAPAPSIGQACAENADCDVAPGDGLCNNLRNFICYDVVDNGTSVGTTQLVDQFGSQTVNTLAPRAYCNPAQNAGDCCNADLDGNGVVEAADASLFFPCFQTTDPTCDINCDGLGDSLDFAILNCQLGAAPDPSCCPGSSTAVYPIVDPLVHLVCYDIDPKVDYDINITTRDAIDSSPLHVRTNEMLCVPSNPGLTAVPEPASAIPFGAALLLALARQRGCGRAQRGRVAGE